MSLFTRLRLFVRDYCSEFGVAWSLARMRDCERCGGHQFGEPAPNPTVGGDLWRTCSRCGTGQSCPTLTGSFTGSAYTWTVDKTDRTEK